MYNTGMSNLDSRPSKDNNLSVSELKTILFKHKTWLETNGRDGGQANLKDCQLKGAVLLGADLRNANLEGAYLYGAYLKNANLENSNLRGANLRGSQLAVDQLKKCRYEKRQPCPCRFHAG